MGKKNVRCSRDTMQYNRAAGKIWLVVRYEGGGWAELLSDYPKEATEMSDLER